MVTRGSNEMGSRGMTPPVGLTFASNCYINIIRKTLLSLLPHGVKKYVKVVGLHVPKPILLINWHI